MTATLTRIAQEVKALAERCGPREAAVIARGLLDGGLRPVLVVSEGTAVDTSVSAVFPQAKILTFEALTQDSSSASLACPLVAVFSWERQISADEISAVEQFFFTRPANTYAFVFTGTTALSPEDLETLQRSAWRLLVQEPKPRWERQDLGAFNIYIVGQGTALVGGRFAEALHTLQTSYDLHDKLAAQALHYAAQLIRGLMDWQSRQDADNRGKLPNRDKLRFEASEIAGLRRRLVSNAEEETAVLTRTLETSVMRLRSDLFEGLHRTLHARKSKPFGSINTEELREALQRYLDTAVSDWLAKTEGQIQSTMDDILSEARRTVRNAEWSIVNEIAASAGSETNWPQRTLDKLADSALRGQPQPVLGPYGHEPDGGTPYVSLAAGGAGMLIALSFLIGPLPAAMTSMLLSAVGLEVYQRRNVREYETYGRGIISGAIETIEELTGNVIGSLEGRFREIVDEEFSAVTGLISQAQGPSSPAQTGADGTPLARLDAVIRELSALNLQA